MTDSPEYIGFIGYAGRSVESGYLDARKSALALLGIDEAMRYFVGVQSSQLQGAEYDLPARVRKGSWEALVPHDLPSLMWPVIAGGATAYGIAAAQKMAENDFRDFGVRQILGNAIEAIQWAIRLGKHLGSMTKRTFGTVQWRNNNTEIGFPTTRSVVAFKRWAGRLRGFGVECRLLEHMFAAATIGVPMLWTVAVILVVLWLLGLIGNIGGGLIHILLVIAVIVIIYNLITGRRVV